MRPLAVYTYPFSPKITHKDANQASAQAEPKPMRLAGQPACVSPSAPVGPEGRSRWRGCCFLVLLHFYTTTEAQLSALPCVFGEKREVSSASVYADEGQVASLVPRHHHVRDKREHTKQIKKLAGCITTKDSTTLGPTIWHGVPSSATAGV